MQSKQNHENISSNCLYRVVRISPEFKPYIPIIGAGLRILLGAWQFPRLRRDGVRNTRVRLTLDDVEAIKFLVQKTNKSTAEIISAALYRAQQSHVRPLPEPGRSVGDLSAS